MKITTLSILGILAVAVTAPAATIVAPTEDVMTSAFFFGPNFVRGYAGDDRPTFRVSSDNAFGTGPETVYIGFDPSDFAAYGAPVASAVLSMQSVDGGFGANAGPADPFLVSAHAVDADPFTSITDNTNPGGLIAWDDFFASNIEAADAAAATVINGFGAVEFDVTALVNDWIGGTNSVFAIAVTAKNDPQTGNGGSGYLHGFLNNTEVPGSTFLTVNAVPEPTSLLIGLTACTVLILSTIRPGRTVHRIG